MNVEWDYTKLASAYLKRPNYAEEAIDEIFNFVEFDKKVEDKKFICDVGAGVAHLTLALAKRITIGGGL